MASRLPAVLLLFKETSKNMRRFVIWSTLLAALFLSSGNSLKAGEKKLMHCFYFTEIAEATDADWEAFKKATAELPDKIPGLNKVWLGKLRRPFNAFNSSGDKSVRQSGVCMELDDQDALGVYSDHPAHAEWLALYEKVRVRGTTTIDILGE
ncbi:MAG: Dabb family protein [Acidobacteria bacterium]|nr:Dabb family protein [Acidobacteriota bacterium]